MSRQDEPLLAKLSAGDIVAPDAEYHNKCLVSPYNRVHTVPNRVQNLQGLNTCREREPLLLTTLT